MERFRSVLSIFDKSLRNRRKHLPDDFAVLLQPTNRE
jgi:hypothetical protein